MYLSRHKLLIGVVAALKLASADFTTITAATPETTDAALLLRREEPKCNPKACGFSVCRKGGCIGNFDCYELKKDSEIGGGKDGCLGWHLPPQDSVCDNIWTDDQLKDMVEAVKQQASKHGQLESTEYKNWAVVWKLGNWAVPNREKYWQVFERLLFQAKDIKEDKQQHWTKGYKHFSYSYDKNFIEINWRNGFGDKCP